MPSFGATILRSLDKLGQGKQDHLLGLKENVIVGHLIPAGTRLRNGVYPELVEGRSWWLDLKRREPALSTSTTLSTGLSKGEVDGGDPDCYRGRRWRRRRRSRLHYNRKESATGMRRFFYNLI